MLLVGGVALGCVSCGHYASGGHSCDVLSVVVALLVLLLHIAFDFVSFHRRHIHPLRSRENGADDAVRLVAHEYHECLGWRFLDYLEDFVCRADIHALRLPDYHELVSALIRLHRQFLYDFVAFRVVYLAFLRFVAYLVQPRAVGQVVVFCDTLSELLQVVVAGFVVLFHDREHEMQVGMSKVSEFEARRADTA